MVALLSLMAIAMLTLSTTVSHTVNSGKAREEAKANARFGLRIALAQLQENLGPDQAITAPATIFDADPSTTPIEGVAHPQLIGIWKSRTVAEIDPGSPGDINENPNYDRTAPFVRWLVSTDTDNDATAIGFAQTGALQEPVKLAELPAPNSNDPDSFSGVFAEKVSIPGGAYAWWVSDENMKARVNRRKRENLNTANSVASNIATSATPGHNGRRVLAPFANLGEDNADINRVISPESLNLVEDVDLENVATISQDVTVSSESVLADVTRGALRQDLSLYLEQDLDWDQPWPRAGRPNPQGPPGPLGPNGKIALSDPATYDVLSWRSLHDYYKAARSQNLDISQTRITSQSKDGTKGVDPVTNPEWNHGSQSLSPVVTRLQMLISYSTKQVQAATDSSPAEYELRLHKFPVLTLWNPYNVPLEVRELNVWLHTLPLHHHITIGSTKHEYKWGFYNPLDDGGGNTVLEIRPSTNLRIAPGAVSQLYASTFDRRLFGRHRMTTRIRPWSTRRAGAGKIVAKAAAKEEDQITIQTEAATWEKTGSSFAGNREGAEPFQSTFGFRAEAQSNPFTPSAPSDETFLYSSQVCWRRESTNPSAPLLSGADFPTRSIGDSLNKPQPFVLVDVRLKTLDESDLPNKTWLHTLPSHPFAAATSTSKHGVHSHTPFYAHPYTVNFTQVTAARDAFSRRPAFGASNSTATGQTKIIDREIPLVPLTSLAQLQNLPLVPIDGLNWSGYHLQNKAIGNSYASPGLAPREVRADSFPFYLGMRFASQGGDLTGTTHTDDTFNGKAGDWTPALGGPLIVDRSYVANELLFDRYFFSSAANQTHQFFDAHRDQKKTLEEVVSRFFADGQDLPNAAYKFTNNREPDDVVRSLVASEESATPDAHRKMAAYLTTEGGFNINSTSINAWATMLASTHKRRPVVISDRGEVSLGREAEFSISRFSTVNENAISNTNRDQHWLGYQTITREQIFDLAEAIVEQVKTRGPFRSLGEFVNRRLTDETDLALTGALQAALDDERVDINERFRSNPLTAADLAATNYDFPEAAQGSRFQGTPDYVSQADLLMTLAPIINARSDTFTIRAYGESSSGAAKAWCEAVVQRLPEYLDPSDEPWIEADQLTSSLNKSLGRRFVVKSFRWLSEDDL